MYASHAYMQDTYTPNIPEPNLIFFLIPPQPGKLSPLGSCQGGGGYGSCSTEVVTPLQSNQKMFVKSILPLCPRHGKSKRSWGPRRGEAWETGLDPNVLCFKDGGFSSPQHAHNVAVILRHFPISANERS